jgi:1,4-dihydroxy-6-naphthoate synthase
VERLRLGISTCPNDTFAFHGLLSGAVRVPGVELDFELADVEALNRGLESGALDVAKASFHAALHLRERCAVLAAGAAVGYGVGPLVLAPSAARAAERPRRVLCPGEWTTATLLYRLFHAGEGQVEQTVFSAIVPELEAGRADRGVCIHEARFTYAARGLHLVEDLGLSWERATGAPLPLGGIIGRKSLGEGLLARVSEGIARSIDCARADPAAALATMRAHAREHSDAVLWAHVELYVTEETRSLSARGRAALSALDERAAGAGLVPPGAALRVVG